MEPILYHDSGAFLEDYAEQIAPQSFPHTVRAKGGVKLAIPALNQLLSAFLKKDLRLTEYISHHHERVQLWLSSGSQNEVDRIAVFRHGILEQLLVVRFLRVSFNDRNPVPVLYDITLHNYPNSPHVTIYRSENDQLQIAQIDYMKLIPKNDKEWAFRFSEDSSLGFNLSTTCLHTQTMVCLNDSLGRTFLTISSAEISRNPISRLRSLVEILNQPLHSIAIRLRYTRSFKKLLEEVFHSSPLHQEVICYLGSDPLTLLAINHFQLRAYQHRYPLANKKIIKEILLNKQLLNPFVYEVAEQGELDPHTNFFYIRERNESSSPEMRIVSYISNETYEKQELQHFITYLEQLKQRFPEAKNNIIEVMQQHQHALTDFSPSFKLILHKLAEGLKGKALDLKQIIFTVVHAETSQTYAYTYQPDQACFVEERVNRSIADPFNSFLELRRYANFDVEYDAKCSTHFSWLFYMRNKQNPKDFRLQGISLVFNKLDCAHKNSIYDLKLQEHVLHLLEGAQASLKDHSSSKKPVWNSLFFQLVVLLHDSLQTCLELIREIIEMYRVKFIHLNIDKLRFKLRLAKEEGMGYRTYLIEAKNFHYQFDLTVKEIDLHHDQALISPASVVDMREQEARAKGVIWSYCLPAEISRKARNFVEKELGKVFHEEYEQFIELDLDPQTIRIHPQTNTIDYNQGELVPVEELLGAPRNPGLNQAGVVIGIKTDDLGLSFPVTRILIIGDVTHDSRSAITAQECARINAAIRLASKMKVPIDWFSVSYGVEIKKEKGVESLDASSSTVREIIKYAHHGHLPINMVIDDTNIGAQSYWDSLCAILQDTKGVLIMTPRGSMALTGHNALTCALYNNVHSEDIPNYAKELYPEGLQSLAGYKLVHGPNGDAMACAFNLEGACEILLRHHYYTYSQRYDQMVEPRASADANFDQEKNNSLAHEVTKLLKGQPAKRELIIEALRDPHSPPMVQWWKDLESVTRQSVSKGDFPQDPHTLVYEMQIGGVTSMVIFPPTGPLTPRDSEIIARAIEKASGRVPVLIIGSLTGFNCDPLSMQNRQLAAGALIAKAVTDHRGPLFVVNLGALVGGTFVILSKQLNPQLKILAVEGSQVKVIGGKSAAKVVFNSRIKEQVEKNVEIQQMKALLQGVVSQLDGSTMTQVNKASLPKKGDAKTPNRGELEGALKQMRRQLTEELENKEASSFEQIHTVERAIRVGSVDAVVSLKTLRNAIIGHLQNSLNLKSS